MKKILTMISAGLLFIATSCNKSQDVQPATTENTADVQQRAAEMNAVQRATVYYNTQLFNTNMMRTPLMRGATVNLLYVINVPSGTASRYLPIVNKLPPTRFDRFAVWQRINVTFTADANLTQPRSDAEVWKMVSAGLATVEKTEAYFQMALTYRIEDSAK